jgi:ferredoxin
MGNATSIATATTVRSVWILDHCIVCMACETTAPEVFTCDGPIAHIRGGARTDGVTDANPGQVPLTAAAQAWSEEIREAAAGCPVEAIKVDGG